MTAHPASDPITTAHTFTGTSAPPAGHPGTFATNPAGHTFAVDSGASWYHPATVVSPNDHGFAGWSFDPANIASGSLPPDGAIVAIKIPVHAPSTVDAVVFGVSTAGATATVGQNFVGLYTVNGDGTGTKLAEGDADAAVTASNDVVEVTFDSAVTIQPGAYYLTLLFNASTRPTVYRSDIDAGAATGGVARLLLNYGQTVNDAPRVVSVGSSVTALPATLDIANDGTIDTGGSRLHWVGLRNAS